MMTFGFSAFVKLVASNERPQRTALRQRLLGGSAGGYDFHRSLKRLGRRFLVHGEALDSVLAAARKISRPPEQRSAVTGIERLAEWRGEVGGEIEDYQAVSYESPSGLFRVNYTPDFGIRLDRQGIAAHIWNTAKPDLNPRAVYGALSLFTDAYAEITGAPDDLALLSLREPRLYRLSEAGIYRGLGASIAERIEDIIRQEHSDLGLPPMEDRPPRR